MSHFDDDTLHDDFGRQRFLPINEAARVAKAYGAFNPATAGESWTRLVNERPDVCQTLESLPSTKGCISRILANAEQGFEPDEADALALRVMASCLAPEQR